jgi:hypothetical protein
MSEPQQPTEEQVKAANAAEEAKWQGDFDEESLAIPYKREEKKDDTNDTRGGTGDDGERSNDQDGTNEGDERVAEITYSEPDAVITVEDPGDYQPANYSFEVTLKDGKTVKVSTPEEAEKLADDPDNFETPKQLMDFINKQNKMNRNLDKDFDKWESQKKTFDEQSAAESERQQAVENYVNEFTYLMDKGLMPKIEEKYRDANWDDPEVAKQPGVREHVELLNYMAKENAARNKSKIKPLTSIVDAYNAWQQDDGHKKAEAKRKEEEEAHQAAGEARKSAGARVAGVSASNQAPYVPKGIAVGRPNVFKRSQDIWND